jgi:hypothetical protein
MIQVLAAYGVMLPLRLLAPAPMLGSKQDFQVPILQQTHHTVSMHKFISALVMSRQIRRLSEFAMFPSFISWYVHGHHSHVPWN